MPVKTIKLTAKRQATFPAGLCRDIALQPGDRVALERRQIDGRLAWVMRSVSDRRDPSWFGVLRSFASGKSHTMDDIRRSIGRKTAETKP